jgi:hypothetical protein
MWHSRQELNLHTTVELMRYAISNGLADIQS